ncbi:MAG: C39 family peptidase [Actinobacteria bacterium]|nr:C39 family peptidase [Actinomycetota bacterium]
MSVAGRRGVFAVALLVFVMLIPMSTFAFANPAGVTPEEARLEAGRLIERVRDATREDPSQPGAVAAFAGAVAGTPLLVRDFEGNPSEYMVPVLDAGGRAIYLIGVGALSGKWHWYCRYDDVDFPVVSAGSAVSKAEAWLRERGADIELPAPQARIAPDKLAYWFFELPGTRFAEMYVPVFLEDKPSSALETRPWERSRQLPAPAGDTGGSAGFPGVSGAAPSLPVSRSASATPRTGGAPAAYDIPDVPYHQQLTDYWCGPASLEMVMDYFGPDIDQAEIASVANAHPSYGCYNTELGRAAQFSSKSTSVQTPSLQGYSARQLGYGMASAYWENGSPLYDYRYSDLKELVSQNLPVLALTSYSPGSGGHFRVVKGYNDSIGTFTVHDPWYTPPYEGPDVQFEQSFFVDTLWPYSDRWAMIAAPWSVTVNKPFSATAGETFTVQASAAYRGPAPLDGQYPCTVDSATATIELGPDFELVGGGTQQPIGSITTTGTSGSASWTVRALDSGTTDGIEVSARGGIFGSTTDYPSYSDWIGGVGTAASAPPVTSRAWAHDSIGVATPSEVWFLAEGCTNGGFETWVLVQNPNTDPAQVHLTYMTPDGPVEGQTETVPASSRMTFNVADVVPETWEVSTMVESDYGVIAERAMYGNGRRWGHDSIGVDTPAPTWYLAEGCTNGGFETWILVQNPNNQPAEVHLTYMTPSGSIKGPDVQLPANSRKTFFVSDSVPAEWSVSAQVTSNRNIIAERAMYGPARAWAHDSVGVPAAAMNWYLAEGCTNGGFETWVLVQNPNDEAANVTLTYMTTDGQVPGPSVSIPANSRETFNVADVVPNTWEVSTRVSANKNVIAERSMYGNGRQWGHDSVGVSVPATDWYLAEGCTNTGFETWVLVQNPNPLPAEVTITFKTPAGPVDGPVETLPARSRKTYNVGNTVPWEYNVSTRVHSNRPVIAERAMYGDAQ